MKIGIDFDNTIACYDISFKEIAMAEGMIADNWNGVGKTELRNHLRRMPEGEKLWMKLQGLAYGKFMFRAEMMPGVARFLLKCRSREHEVFIISHKTEYGHFDQEKISLRKQALKWMEAKRFFDTYYFDIKKENVFFSDTRQEKVSKIAKLECDYFIDDLPEVFEEAMFPGDTQKILFNPYGSTKDSDALTLLGNWEDISIHLLGPTTDGDVGDWASRTIGYPIKKISRISGRGNSRLYMIMTENGELYTLKYYPDRLEDSRPRLKTEFNACRLLHQESINFVPRAVEKDEMLDFGLYEWIEGESITEPILEDLQQVIDFVERLFCFVPKIDGNDISLASEACLSANDLIIQINRRFKRLNAVKERYHELASFLEQTFEPLAEEVVKASYYRWPIESRDRRLPREKQMLSPSDFGFHNAIKNNGKITFIDFEYFGWDDPVKLTADFIWHPAMELDSEMIGQWKKAMLALFSDDRDFADRLLAALPLYGLRWALIMLNEFLPGYAERRRNAGDIDNFDEKKLQKIQLFKAKRYCERVRSCISDTHLKWKFN
jgi:hypothetical protein